MLRENFGQASAAVERAAELLPHSRSACILHAQIQ